MISKVNCLLKRAQQSSKGDGIADCNESVMPSVFCLQKYLFLCNRLKMHFQSRLFFLFFFFLRLKQSFYAGTPVLVAVRCYILISGDGYAGRSEMIFSSFGLSELCFVFFLILLSYKNAQ
jgi:hypothetical protein